MQSTFLSRGCLLALLATALVSADDLETLDGEKLSGSVTAISTNGDITGEGIPAGTTLDSLRQITRPAKPIESQAKILVETSGGGKLNVSSLELADDKFKIVLSTGNELTLPLDAVRAVRLEPGLALAAFAEALAKPSADIDRIFVKVDKQVDTVRGLITSLNEDELKFEFEGEERKLPRDRLHGIVLAQASAGSPSASTIHLADGSRLAGKPVSLEGDTLQVELQGAAKVDLPIAIVSRIELQSVRLRYLSEGEPETVREEVLLTLPRPWQRDKSVAGKPITLGGRTFARGIGVHARSELTFAVPEGFDAFVSTVGIDAATQGKGDCEVKVLADGEVVLSQRVKGTDSPRPIRIDLKNAKKLTLVVEPGVDLDLADHLDWADARWMQTKKK